LPLVLADMPVPVHAEADNVIPHDVGGGENAVQVPLELAMQHDIESATDKKNVIASVGLEYIPVQENPQVIED
jgi:hypothetical protein